MTREQRFNAALEAYAINRACALRYYRRAQEKPFVERACDLDIKAYFDRKTNNALRVLRELAGLGESVAGFIERTERIIEAHKRISETLLPS